MNAKRKKGGQISSLRRATPTRLSLYQGTCLADRIKTKDRL